MIKKYRKIALIEAMQYTENNTREILEWINENNKYENKDITFLYTVRKDKQVLYQEKFTSWNTRENFRGYAQQGRFSNEQLDSYLPIGKNYNYIIAGPMTMNRAYSKLLQEKGISKNNIYYEGFNF